mgnify:CR=1 FL=1
MRKLFSTYLLFLVSATSVGQNTNELLNRGFWKSQPSIANIQEKIYRGHSPTQLTEFSFDATGYAILENNSIKTIKFLLSQGNDVNKLIHDARSYIFWAAYKNNLFWH